MVTAKAPTKSAIPVSRGATKSASARFGRPSRFAICWRSVRNVASGLVRASSRQATMSSPTAFAGQKPTTASARRAAVGHDAARGAPAASRWRSRAAGAHGRVVEDRRVARRESSQVVKNGVPVDPLDELGRADTSRNVRTPRNEGRGGSAAGPVDAQPVRPRLGRGRGAAPPARRSPRSAADRRRTRRGPRPTNASCWAGSRRARATPTARDASWTWTTGPE